MVFYSLCASTVNIGDEIQIIAAQRHYPRVDAYVDRDRLKWDLRKAVPGKIVLNGWYMHRKFLRLVAWPPPEHIDALCVSIHVSPSRLVQRAFSSPRSIEFLRRNGPVGARDGHTEDFLKSLGIDTYFSGCMTMTLQSKGYDKTGPIVFCDPIRGQLWGFQSPATYLPRLTKSGIPLEGAVTVTHEVSPGMPREQRFAKARELLDLYDRASLVITSRLHCALPCLAMRTPVIFLSGDAADPRFTRLMPILQPVSFADLAAGKARPITDPLPSELPDALIKRCNDFFAA